MIRKRLLNQPQIYIYSITCIWLEKYEIFAHLFTINTLIENNADTPDINPVIDYWRTVVRASKTFRRKVPIGPGSLRCQLNPVITILAVNYLLRKAEISDFYISTNWPISQQNIP